MKEKGEKFKNEAHSDLIPLIILLLPLSAFIFVCVSLTVQLNYDSLKSSKTGLFFLPAVAPRGAFRAR